MKNSANNRRTSSQRQAAKDLVAILGIDQISHWDGEPPLRDETPIRPRDEQDVKRRLESIDVYTAPSDANGMRPRIVTKCGADTAIRELLSRPDPADWLLHPVGAAFLIKNGRYMGERYPCSASVAAERHCALRNSARLVLASRVELHLCVGFAEVLQPEEDVCWVLHAWCVDISGQVQDPSWRPTLRSRQYYGVALDFRQDELHQFIDNPFGCLLWAPRGSETEHFASLEARCIKTIGEH